VVQSRADLGRRRACRARRAAADPRHGRDVAGQPAPDDLRGTAAGVDFLAQPFVPLYRTDDEFAAELSNRTIHAVMHLAWAEQASGDYQGQMAVYVKPRWHAARERRSADLDEVEGAEQTARTQSFLWTVANLAAEQRLSRLAYLARRA
jgi:hypothetical protein